MLEKLLAATVMPCHLIDMIGGGGCGQQESEI